MPTQHLNLLDAALHAPKLRFSAAQVILASGVLLAGAAALATGIDHLARHTQADARALAARVVAHGAEAAASAPAELVHARAELKQLRALEATQRRVGQALDQGADAMREGYVEYFVALARQAQPDLWITGLAVGADNSTLSLEGRMTDAAVLPAYLRRLNEEARFRGRPFAQLQIKAVDEPAPAAGPAFTEFTLRSQPPAGGSR